MQNSAFEGELKEGEVEKVKVGLNKLIEKDRDSIILYETPDTKWVTKEVLGIEKSEVTTVASSPFINPRHRRTLTFTAPEKP